MRLIHILCLSVVSIFSLVVAFSPNFRMRTSSSLSSSRVIFDLENYAASELVVDKTAPIVDSISELGIANEFDEKTFSHIMLVDFGVREISSLEEYCSIPGVKRFLSKLKRDKNVLDDKFMYSYDIGVKNECMMVMARIPEKNYMKLDLAKQIISSLKSPNIFVSLVDEQGTIKLDRSI